MFNEEPMYGIFDVSVDSKNRIIIPSKTKVCQGDKLVILKDGDIIKIMAESWFDSIIADLENKANIELDLDKKKAIEEAIYRLCKTVYKTSVADKQGRIVLSNELGLTNRIKVIGCRSYLRLEKTR